MSKIIPERIVEYAYVKSIVTIPNMKTVINSVTKYFHKIIIVYELKNAQKELLLTDTTEHIIEVANIEPIIDLETKLHNQLVNLINQDKNNLSGYIAQ